MTNYEQGDVLLVPFPFTNQATTKRRPAVVLSTLAYNQSHLDVILAAITSQSQNRPNTVLLKDWQLAGLVKPSAVKPIVSTFDPSLIIRQLGTLTADDKQAVRQMFRDIFDLP